MRRKLKFWPGRGQKRRGAQFPQTNTGETHHKRGKGPKNSRDQGQTVSAETTKKYMKL